MSQIANDNGCQIWTGSTNGRGYGQISVGSRRDGTRRKVYAHRLALEAKLGRPIASGMDACHTCDNRACVNPDHLWEGSRAENMRDCARKGRTMAQAHPERLARGDQNGARLHPERVARGEAHGSVKLTEDDVREIRAAGGLQREIAARFGVTPSLIGQIRRRKIWRHLTDNVPAQAA